jgi:Fe-S cluster biosynthesis and repair protein YggX
MMKMTERLVYCKLLKREMPGLAFQTYPGELGKKIFENISMQAWQDWLAHQTILINEHRLSPIEPEHRKFLEGEMEKYFFGGGSEVPESFIPQK